jgi:biotin carboxyl carrier protein
VTYEVEIDGRMRLLSVTRVDGAFHVTVDGRPFEVDAARIDAHVWSLIVNEVRLKPDATNAMPDVGSAFRRTFEVTFAPDPASSQVAVGLGSVSVVVGVNGRRLSGRRSESSSAARGPQRVVAPMPGKIVRVLVQSGEAVRARQPLVVVEAMKMENELRAARDGTIAEVRAEAGQSVDAGAVLVVIQ